MQISRREFFSQSTALLLSSAPILSSRIRFPNLLNGASLPQGKNILVLIHLAGGNDWYNTVIPYTAQGYLSARPNLAITATNVLKLNDEYALHPALGEFKRLYESAKAAILLDYGSAERTLSHHKANAGLQLYRRSEREHSTWQGHYASTNAHLLSQGLIFPAFSVEPQFEAANKGLICRESVSISALKADNNFTFDLDNHYRIGHCQNAPSSSSFDDLRVSDFRQEASLQIVENDALHKSLEFVARMIEAKANATVYSVSFGGFDTHADQPEKHAYLLSALSRSLWSMQNKIEKAGLADNVLTLVCSEFGRSLEENCERGTDHGYVNHLLAIGNGVQKGLFADAQIFTIGAQEHVVKYSSLSDIALAWLS